MTTPPNHRDDELVKIFSHLQLVSPSEDASVYELNMNHVTLKGVPEAKAALQAYVQREVVKAEKAYGGCHLCYGKGYATVRSGTRGSADFYGDKSFVIPPTDKMKFCTCERGKQLKAALKAKGATHD